MKNLQFRDNLKMLKKKHRVSKEDLGEVLGVNPATYYRWESDTHKMPMDAVITLADYYDISLYELLGIEDKSTTTKQELTIPKTLSDTAIEYSEIIKLMAKIPEGNTILEDIQDMLQDEVDSLQDEKAKQA